MDPITLAKRLFPLQRSLTGQGVRDTLAILREINPGLRTKSFRCGTRCFDWRIPPEWTIRSACIKNLAGSIVVDYADNNLHVVGYSEPVDKIIPVDELQRHVHSLPSQPDAIPYVTSYYRRTWGFCMSEKCREFLTEQEYRVHIDSDFNSQGSMDYGEIYIRGASKKEVLVSTYICHPSMANNEVSGPVVAIFISQWLRLISMRRRLRYSYRFLFLPETIGSIAYISKNIRRMKRNIIAGFVISCIGDNRSYSYVPSRDGNTLADRVAKVALRDISEEFKQYTWNDRGSDERQYCAPGVDLPVCSILRTKYGEYPEYHTSLDDFSVVTSEGLRGGLGAIKAAIRVLETNHAPKCNFLCEPNLGSRSLYPTTSQKGAYAGAQVILNVLSCCDGRNDLIAISEIAGIKYSEVLKIVNRLLGHKVLRKVL